MMKFKNIINTVKLLIIIFAMNTLNGEELVWEEKFDNNGSLESLGWKREKNFDKDEFKVKDGKLKALCAHNPYKGSLYSHPIPFIKRGYITFDVKSNGTGYNHLSLQVIFNDILTSFSGLSGGIWCRYYRPPKKDWKTVGQLPNRGRKWTKYKIAFDVDAGTVEYYIGDMDNPARFDRGVVIKPGKDGKGTLKIGNYGLARGSVLNEIDNIRLVTVSDKQKEAESSNSVMLFRGIAFDYYQLDKIVQALKISKSTNYNLKTYGAAVKTKNQFCLDRNPHPHPASLPKYIILADMPLKGVVPEYVQKMIVDTVKKGGTLLILGGLFTLNKGDFRNTPIENILPVKLDSPWELKKLKNSEEIKTSLSGKPEVKFLHPLKIKQGAQILVKAGNNPFIVSGRYGKGKVVVCLGMPCGKFATNETPFWKWSKWPKFIVSIID